MAEHFPVMPFFHLMALQAVVPSARLQWLEEMFFWPPKVGNGCLKKAEDGKTGKEY